MAQSTGKRDIAVDELSAATRIAPTAPLYAAKLALTLAETGDTGRAAEAAKRAERLTDFGLDDHDEAQLAIIKAFRKIDASEWADKLEKRRELTHHLTEIRSDAGGDPVSALRKLLASLNEEKRDWEAARVRTELGRAIRDAKNGSDELAREADECFTAALAWFQTNYPQDNRVAELHSDRALALAALPDRSGEALVEAETAVTLDPLRASYREVLSRVHEAGGDLDSACEAADRALLLDPDDPALHFRLGTLKWNLAESIADPDVHKRERRAAVLQFEEAMKLYERSQRDERRMTHWWLAMSYFAMSDFSQVPAHLRFVLISTAPGDGVETGQRGLEVAAELWLGMAYRKLQKFTDAERHLAKAIRQANDLAAHGLTRATCLTDAVDDGRWPLGIVIALAHMQRAGCHADRGGVLAQAEDDLDNARAALEAMERFEELGTHVKDGWSDYHAERGRVRLAQGDPLDAIDELRTSAELDPGEADVYLLLARAYARAAEERRLEQDGQKYIGLGVDACRRTWEIAGDGHPDTLAAEEVAEQLAGIAAARSSAQQTVSEQRGTPQEPKWSRGGRAPWEGRTTPQRFKPGTGPTPSEPASSSPPPDA
jgi:tetratricopeptide (TPR) repeat protein